MVAPVRYTKYGGTTGITHGDSKLTKPRVPLRGTGPASCNRSSGVRSRRCCRLSRFAKGDELVLANLAELHPNIQSGDRDQMGRLWATVPDEGSPACLKRCKNREQLLF